MENILQSQFTCLQTLQAFLLRRIPTPKDFKAANYKSGDLHRHPLPSRLQPRTHKLLVVGISRAIHVQEWNGGRKDYHA